MIHLFSNAEGKKCLLWQFLIYFSLLIELGFRSSFPSDYVPANGLLFAFGHYMLFTKVNHLFLRNCIEGKAFSPSV